MARSIVAVHEAGHAIVAHLVGIGLVGKFLIVSEGGGEADVGLRSELATLPEVEAFPTDLFAGRAADILAFGAATTGSGGVLRSDLALAMERTIQIKRSSRLGANGLCFGEPLPDEEGRQLSVAKRQRVMERLAGGKMEGWGGSRGSP